MTGSGEENADGRHRVRKLRWWGVGGLVGPVVMVGSVLPDNSLVWATLGPLGFVCFVGWVVAGIVMFHSWQKALTGADGHAKRAASAAAWGLYAIVLPAFFSVWVVPGYTTAARAIVIVSEVYAVFWLLGGVVVVARRRG